MKLPVITDWDDAYANGPHIENAGDFPPKWEKLAEGFRGSMAAQGRALLDVAYGTENREVMDIFLPEAMSKGIAMFVHGGYWHLFDKSSWSHLAQGALDNGWTVVMPSYTLAPEAHLTRMTTQISSALEVAAKMYEGPIRLSGHSAGGHLVTRQICENSPLSKNVQKRIERVVSISGVHDLRPIMKTEMNKTLFLDEDEALAESPVLQPPIAGADLVCWVGANERPEFVRQNKLLADVWTGFGIQTEWHEEPSKHHFDVIEDLANMKSGLTIQFAP